MWACSGTAQPPDSLWAAAQPGLAVPVIHLDPDSLKDCSHCGRTGMSNIHMARAQAHYRGVMTVDMRIRHLRKSDAHADVKL